VAQLEKPDPIMFIELKVVQSVSTKAQNLLQTLISFGVENAKV